MLTNEIIVEIARNLNLASAQVSAQCIPLLNGWQRDWNTRWPYADYLETSASSDMTASTQQYQLASDMDKLYDLWIPTLATKLDRLTEEQLRALGPSALYGPPVAYATFGEFGVNFWPIPASAYGFSYSYYKSMTEITTASALSAQTPAITPKYHEAGVWYATWRMAQRMGDTGLVELAMAEYDRVFALAAADMINRVAGTKRVLFADEQYTNTRVVSDKATEMFNGN